MDTHQTWKAVPSMDVGFVAALVVLAARFLGVKWLMIRWRQRLPCGSFAKEYLVHISSLLLADGYEVCSRDELVLAKQKPLCKEVLAACDNALKNMCMN